MRQAGAGTGDADGAAPAPWTRDPFVRDGGALSGLAADATADAVVSGGGTTSGAALSVGAAASSGEGETGTETGVALVARPLPSWRPQPERPRAP